MAVYIVLAQPLILLFNRNPAVVEFGKWLLISQVALLSACVIGWRLHFRPLAHWKWDCFSPWFGKVFYVPFILALSRIFGVSGIRLSPLAADVLTVFLYPLLIKPMKRMASKMMAAIAGRLENLCSNSWIFLLVRLIADENEVWINCGNTNETIYFRITFECNSDTKGSD